MPHQLEEGSIVTGTKQTMRALEQHRVVKVYAAKDADMYVVRPVIEAANMAGIPIVYMDSKKKLGSMCGIDIAAAVAALLTE